MKLTVKKYGINGEGIAYDHKTPVFVYGALVDEEIEARIIENQRNYKRASITKINKKSAHRVKVACPHYEKCGACSLLHADYQEQLRCKKQILEESLEKYTEIQRDIEIVPSPKQINYRNSLKLPVSEVKGQLCVGLYKQGTNHFNQINSCLNHDKQLEANLKIVLKILNKFHLKAYQPKLKSGIRYLTLRIMDQKCALCIVTGNDVIDQSVVDDILSNSDIVSIYQAINTAKTHEIYGNRLIHLGGLKKLSFKFDTYKIAVSIRSFLQLNSEAAHNLYTYVDSLISGDKNLIVEAYSGVGLMSFMLHSKAKQVVGIEIIPEAVSNANKNAAINKIDNLKFILGDAGDVIYRQFRKTKIDAMIVDPPRTGLDDKMLDCLLKAKIDEIVYVSCNSASLSKDLAILKSRYHIASIKAFDLFPNTQHVETIVLLSKLKTKKHVNIELHADELDLTSSECKATYNNIKQYVFDKYGFKVSNLYIAQVKEKCGIKERENYNKPKNDDSKQPICPIEKEEAIKDAFRYFQMI